MPLAGPARAPMHDRTPAPRSRAMCRRSREACRIAPPRPRRSRRPSSRTDATQAHPSRRFGSGPDTGARSRVPEGEFVARPSPRPRILHAPARLPGHACRQAGACDGIRQRRTTRRRAPSRCRDRGCSGASARLDARCAGTPPAHGRRGRTRAMPRSRRQGPGSPSQAAVARPRRRHADAWRTSAVHAFWRREARQAQDRPTPRRPRESVGRDSGPSRRYPTRGRERAAVQYEYRRDVRADHLGRSA